LRTGGLDSCDRSCCAYVRDTSRYALPGLVAVEGVHSFVGGYVERIGGHE